MSEIEKDEAVESEARIYEVGYHIVPLVAEENVPKEAGDVKFLIEKQKGVIISEELPRLHPLAYTIAKTVAGKKRIFDKAYFGWIKFEADATALPAIKEAMEANENVLRFLLIKTVRENTLVSMQKIISQARMDKEGGEKKAPGVGATAEKDKKPVSVEELDKSIDELLK
ncbi:MAG: 30S ribosomal protein S6 [Candidatus Pacebacteria bacterium]|nr:30S ribosomal protein S6 [Candidatus Paceibacterota bacterium]MDD5356950.1 30S ribosomal protein S6 [Candidatus Paceibacterota bacterium]